MKIACDRCLKIVCEGSEEDKSDWLKITTRRGTTYAFCKKCTDVFLKTMFALPEKKDGGEQDES